MDVTRKTERLENDAREYYLREVLPRMETRLEEKYPLARIGDCAGYHPLGERELMMLVGLTGAGKSTTLDLLRNRMPEYDAEIIPSRRDLADWIAIPLAQSLLGEPIRPVRDRARRFHYTRIFAERVRGGMAAAFSWLNLADDCRGVVLSEGIRGENEIRFALECFPRWKIVELALPPLKRLRRLSDRRDAFDQVDGNADLFFLPAELRPEAELLLEAGEISAEALAIMRAEAANYGLYPFGEGARYANYHRVDVDGFEPEDVADAVIRLARLR